MTELQKEILRVAETYLEHADELIYSYAGRTFFSGYALYDIDYDNRGNIDCSTYMHLVMQGIPYDKSPYRTGWVESALKPQTTWAQTKFLEDLRRDGYKRRAWGIAKHYFDQGLTFDDRRRIEPADLVFYQAPEDVLRYYEQHGCFMGISHIGMVSENTEYILHSTGYPEKADSEAEGMKAIQYTHILDGRTPILYARPNWKR